MDNWIWTGELLISDGAHSLGLCCQIEHTHPCPLKMLGQITVMQHRTAPSGTFSLFYIESFFFLSPAISAEFVEMGLCSTPWVDGKIDQWHLLYEAIIGGDSAVTIQCFANTTASHFHGNAGGGMLMREREWNRQTYLLRYFLSELLIVKLYARELHTKTCPSKRVNKHRRDRTNVHVPWCLCFHLDSQVMYFLWQC